MVLNSIRAFGGFMLMFRCVYLISSLALPPARAYIKARPRLDFRCAVPLLAHLLLEEKTIILISFSLFLSLSFHYYSSFPISNGDLGC